MGCSQLSLVNTDCCCWLLRLEFSACCRISSMLDLVYSGYYGLRSSTIITFYRCRLPSRVGIECSGLPLDVFVDEHW